MLKSFRACIANRLTVKSEPCFHSVELLQRLGKATSTNNIVPCVAFTRWFKNHRALASVQCHQTALFPIIWSSLMLCMQEFIGRFIKSLSVQYSRGRSVQMHFQSCNTVFSTLHWWHCMQYKIQECICITQTLDKNISRAFIRGFSTY